MQKIWEVLIKTGIWAVCLGGTLAILFLKFVFADDEKNCLCECSCSSSTNTLPEISSGTLMNGGYGTLNSQKRIQP